MNEERIDIAGLGAAGTITVDRWGIPHVKAESLEDLFFLQGFAAARDRLWQIDLWRKRGLGLLAKDFGPGFLEQDVAARMFLYRGDMDAEWAAYGPDTRMICRRFTAGINVYVALTEREPARLPPEFALMGTRPATWRPEDVLIIRSHGLTRNALWEVQRLAAMAAVDPATDRMRRVLEPDTTPFLAPGIVPGSIPVEALDAFRLAQAGVTFTPERLAATPREAGKWRKVDDLANVFADPDWSGSNNWAVSAARTGTGAPVLASDPHRAHAVPSLRWLVHLTAPGLDVIGAGEPAVPGVSLGHNGTAAFGLTIFCADQEDTYVLDLDPADPNRYRFGPGTEAMRVVEELFDVKGEVPQRRTLTFSRHGPILWRSPDGRRAVTVRSVWFEPGAAPYLHSLKYMGAKTLVDFRAGAAGWGAPAVNLVYADRAGTIAWMPRAFMPRRQGFDGILPVPGDGRFEWAGFIPSGDMPDIVNPAGGFVASANEMNLPPEWDHAANPVSFEWTEGSRARRIKEVLGAGEHHGVAEARALQTDPTSLPARRTLALLARSAGRAEIAAALRLFAGWDHRLDTASAPAALFEVWWTHHLKPALIARFVHDPAIRKLFAPGDVEGLLRTIEEPDPRWGADPTRARDDLLAATLASAYADVERRLGPDAATWSWGRLHHGFFEHGLSTCGAPVAWNVGPLPKGGSASSPMHAGYRPSDFRVIAGASFRMVVDLADPDRSVTLNSPGQSGDPRSPHYADLAATWARGDYVPMAFTDAAVEAAAETRITLLPTASG